MLDSTLLNRWSCSVKIWVSPRSAIYSFAYPIQVVGKDTSTSILYIIIPSIPQISNNFAADDLMIFTQDM